MALFVDLDGLGNEQKRICIWVLSNSDVGRCKEKCCFFEYLFIHESYSPCVAFSFFFIGVTIPKLPCKAKVFFHIDNSVFFLSL